MSSGLGHNLLDPGLNRLGVEQLALLAFLRGCALRIYQLSLFADGLLATLLGSLPLLLQLSSLVLILWSWTKNASAVIRSTATLLDILVGVWTDQSVSDCTNSNPKVTETLTQSYSRSSAPPQS